jgi:hypothetical protein
MPLRLRQAVSPLPLDGVFRERCATSMQRRLNAINGPAAKAIVGRQMPPDRAGAGAEGDHLQCIRRLRRRGLDICRKTTLKERSCCGGCSSPSA